MNNREDGRSFKALLANQFLCAFIDNLFKVTVSLYAIQVLLTSDGAARFVSMLGILFILPYVLFSPAAGILADRFPKRKVIVVMSAVKVLMALFSAWSLWTGNLWFLSAVLFLFMVDSALFGPSKTGILPEMLGEADLSKGNGFYQLWTFAGIILGTAVGGLLYKTFSHRLYWIGGVMVILALAGLALSFLIKSGEPPSHRSKGRFSQCSAARWPESAKTRDCS